MEIREQKEIEAVLAALSNQTCDHLDELTLDLELIGELDFIFAKAALSRHYRGCEPRLNKDGIIRLKMHVIHFLIRTALCLLHLRSVRTLIF